jgi:hypothetical protein
LDQALYISLSLWSLLVWGRSVCGNKMSNSLRKP